MKIKTQNTMNALKWKKSLLIGISAFLLIGALLMTSVVGIDSSRLLSQFSGANVTPATASLMWSASSNNPNRPKVATYSTRLDGIIVRILSKGSTLNTTAYKIYLGNLSEGIKAIGSKPEYTSDQEIKAIVGYLTYELDDAKNTLSAGGTIFTEISNLIEGTNTTPATTNTSLATPTNVVTNTQTSTTGTPSTPSVSPNWIGSTININQLSVGGAPVIVARNTAGMIAQSVELMVVNTSYQQALNGGWLAANTNTDLDKFSVTIGASSAGEFINLYKLSEPSASPYGPDASINYDLAVKIKSADGVYRSVQFKVQKSAGSNWGTAATTWSTTANTSGITTSSEYSSADFEKKTAKIGDTVTLKYSFTPDRKCKLLDGRNGGSRAVIAELEQKINATYSFVVKSEHVVPTSWIAFYEMECDNGTRRTRPVTIENYVVTPACTTWYTYNTTYSACVKETKIALDCNDSSTSAYWYKKYLNRCGDPEGIKYWNDQIQLNGEYPTQDVVLATITKIVGTQTKQDYLNGSLCEAGATYIGSTNYCKK